MSAAANLTLLVASPKETYETDITYKLPTTNAEFLAGIFRELLTGPDRPAVTAFVGNPATASPSVWAGHAHTGADVGGPGLNGYFTLALYQPGQPFRRTKTACAGIVGVMLDDVGTKALPLARLAAVPPSIVIETSTGNFQASYLFDTPQADIARVDSLNKALIAAGLCDPGATGPAARWGRLPFAVNGKRDPVFSCRLVEWHPDRRYSIDDIVVGLELAPVATSGARRKERAPRAQLIDNNTADDVYIPRADENPVITELKKRGLYKQPLGSGKHDITCPWVAEHTDAQDHGTAYFEPSDIFPIGGFKCQHGHGGRTLRMGALLEFLALTISAAKHKPTIKAMVGELHRVTDAAERELAQTGRYFQRGGLIVSISTDPETTTTAIKPVTQPALMRALCSVATWTRFDARSASDVVCDPPQKYVITLADSERYEHLPVLAGLARQPHLAPDGRLVDVAGYDTATRLFGVFDARAFSVPPAPTKEVAARALTELNNLLSEFCFATPTDRAAAIAGILTAAIRPSLPTAPMFHVRAPQVASGKSYLCSIIAAFGTPESVSATGFPVNDEECQKQLLALLLEAPAVVQYDNLTTDLIPFKALCSCLTEEHLTGRVLGVSKVATVGTRTLFLSSGNNVGPVRDMTRRCVTITLTPDTESPATRHFDHEPLSIVRAQRGRFVSLALTIIRAWIVAGRPRTDCKPLNSYQAWTELVRQPLLWLGQPDPVLSVFETMAADPDRETLGRLLHAWLSAFGGVPTMIRKAVTGAGAHPELNEAMLEVADERGEINRRRLGRWIARHASRIVDGLRFVKASGTTSAEQWRVERVTTDQSVLSVLSVSSSEPTESVSELVEEF